MYPADRPRPPAQSHRWALPISLILVSAVIWAGLTLVAWGTGAPTGTEDDPAVAYDSVENQFLRVWEQWDGSYYQLRSDLRAAGGGSVTSEQALTSAGGGSQLRPAAAYDPTTGRFLLVWDDNDSTRIAGQLIKADGGTTGSVRNVATGEADYEAPHVAANTNDGGFLVVWEAAIASQDIFAQRVKSDGSNQGSVITVDDGGNQQIDPVVAFDSVNGQYLVVYDEDDIGSGIHARFVNADDASTGSIITDIAPNGTGPGVPAVAYDADNERFFIVWDNNDTSDVEGRMLDPDGGFLTDTMTIASPVDATPDPAIAFDPISCEYLVAWEDNDNTFPDIVGQRFDVGGNTSGGAETLIEDAAIAYRDPAVAANTTDGGFLVVAVNETAVTPQIVDTIVSATAASGRAWPPSGGSGMLGVTLTAAALLGLVLLVRARGAGRLRPALATTLAVALLNVAVLGGAVSCGLFDEDSGGKQAEHTCLEE